MKQPTQNDIFSDMVGFWGIGQILFILLAGITKVRIFMLFYFIWAIGFPFIWIYSPNWFINIMTFIFKKLYH